jgi:hypothetical protein
MEHRDFCYWLQGFFELTNTDVILPEQVAEIKEHLNATFTKFPRGLKPSEPVIFPSIDPGFARCTINTDPKPSVFFNQNFASC